MSLEQEVWASPYSGVHRLVLQMFVQDNALGVDDQNARLRHVRVCHVQRPLWQQAQRHFSLVYLVFQRE